MSPVWSDPVEVEYRIDVQGVETMSNPHPPSVYMSVEFVQDDGADTERALEALDAAYHAMRIKIEEGKPKK